MTLILDVSLIKEIKRKKNIYLLHYLGQNVNALHWDCVEKRLFNMIFYMPLKLYF